MSSMSDCCRKRLENFIETSTIVVMLLILGIVTVMQNGAWFEAGRKEPIVVSVEERTLKQDTQRIRISRRLASEKVL